MTNKQQVQKLRDYAELAMAAYGYFHLETSENNPTFINVKDNEEQEIQKEISLTDILDITYKDYEVYIPSRLPTIPPEKIGTLDSDFTPTQAKRFFEKYDLLKHQHNTNSGFSATLFAEKRLQINKETKEKSYTAKYGYTNYILSFRGTEVTKDLEQMLQDFYTDFLLARNKIPQQYFDMIDFIETQIKPIIYDNATQSYAKMTITGHSLGGFLAQMFALSYPELVEEVYTYNAPGVFNDETAKLIERIFVGAMTFLALTHHGHIALGTGIIGSSIYSLFQSKTNIAPNQMITIDNNTKLYGGMIEINESLFRRIESYQTNSRKLLAISGNDTIAYQLRHTIPYFLRTDQEEVVLQKMQDNKGIQKIYYQPSMQKEAQKLYDTIKAYRETHKDQTFYVYYAYAFTHQATSIQISESTLAILDYEIGIPYNKLLSQRQSLKDNKQYIDKTLDSQAITHHISRNAKGELDTIGNLGIKIPAQRYEIQISGESLHSIIPLTQTLYFCSYLLESNLIEEEEKSLSEYIAYCNTFNENIKTHTDTFMLKAINNSNMRNYNTKALFSSPVFFLASLNHLLGDKPQEIDYLALFISIIYAKVHKIEALKKDRNDYVIPAITKEQIIDTIIELSNNGFYIKILDKEFFATIRKQCDFINDDKNIAYKSCIAAYQNFIIINKDNEPIETKEQLGSIYGYNSAIYKTAINEWEDIFLGASCKMIQGLYFNGKAKVAMLTS